VLGVAQTGTGKTAAFALPVLQAMMHGHGSLAQGPRYLSGDPRAATRLDRSRLCRLTRG
jgi:superfamily II DNA/RNA helicase